MSGTQASRVWVKPLWVNHHTLDITWPIDTHISFVLSQPSIRVLGEETGFRWHNDHRSRQTQLVLAALELARTKDANLTVFPEYCIPAVDWPAVQQWISANLPCNAVVIAGLDAVTPSMCMELASTLGGSVSGLPEGNFEWANCCVVCAKSSDGRVRSVFQPKLRPAPPEQDLGGMLRGDTFNVFCAGRLSFAVLVCFDLIASLETDLSVSQWLSREQQANAIPPLNLLVNVQCNTDPDHVDFRDAQSTIMIARRVDALLVANMARPGGSGLYYSPQWFLDKPKKPPRTYAARAVPGCRMGEARFRTSQPAVFYCQYAPYPPRTGQGDRLPFPVAVEHAVDENSGSVSADGIAVAAHAWAASNVAEKFKPIQPEGSLPSDARWHLPEYYGRTRDELRKLDPWRIEQQLGILFGVGPAATNLHLEPLYWDEPRGRQFADLIRVLAIVSIPGPIDLGVNKKDVTAQLRWDGPVTIDDQSSGSPGASVTLLAGPHVAVIAGDHNVPVESVVRAHLQTIGALDTYRGTTNTVLVLLDCDGLPADRFEAVPVKDEKQRLLSFPGLAQVDAAPRPIGAATTQAVRNIRDTTCRVACCGRAALESALARGNTLEIAADYLRSLFGPITHDGASSVETQGVLD